MTIIGLTGTSGSGKNTVAKVFERFQIAHIDCDELARRVTRRGQPCVQELAERFPGVLNVDGSLNRRALAERCFTDENNLKSLNEITHRHILLEVDRRMAELEAEGFQYVCVTGAALIESGFNKRCDVMVCIHASRKTRIKRIVERDLLSTKEAEERIDAQRGDEYYSDGADYTIENNGKPDDLFERAAAVALQITQKGAV